MPSPVALSKAWWRTPGGRSTRWSGVFCGGDDSARREGLFDLRGAHALGFRRVRRVRRWNWGFRSPLIEDQYQFVLHHEVLWQGSDVDVAVPLGAGSAGAVSGVAGVQLRPGLSPSGQSGRAGRAARPERVAEEGTSFERRPAAGGRGIVRRRAPSNTRRLSRPSTGWSIGVWTVSATMAPTASRGAVALSVLAANLHRIGLLLQKRERTRRRRVA